ncbi:uncharacterized protein LOC133172394 [Saccostrea echinata]|uniref:uncharacterized protein LOC133172394 n=1 Tax=Saccostrea echinata TaxID=191078 RepID=UPI002A82A197|nr:uncharacterized protein LOC133172394 [Saccostrea echinata]
MEKISNLLFHHGNHDHNSHEHHDSNKYHGNLKSHDFESNPIPPKDIVTCQDGLLDVCVLRKDTMGVCSYLKKEINVYETTGTKIFTLSSSDFPQYLSETKGGILFTALDENKVFKAPYPPFTNVADKRDVDMVPDQRDKNESNKKSSSATKTTSAGKDSKSSKKQNKGKAKEKQEEKMEVDEDGKTPKAGGKMDGDRTADNVYDMKAEAIFSTGEWIPRGIHCTKLGDIIVCLWNGQRGEKSHGKVVKYSNDGKVKKEIDICHHKPLYACPMYVTENHHEDICVSDWMKKSVIAVNRSGSKKFEYEGHKEQNDEEKKFDPRGLGTDSFSNFIIADYWYHRLHILNESGHFLRFIIYDNIRGPTGVYVDENNMLYVCELGGKSINVIKYLR